MWMSFNCLQLDSLSFRSMLRRLEINQIEVEHFTIENKEQAFHRFAEKGELMGKEKHNAVEDHSMFWFNEQQRILTDIFHGGNPANPQLRLLQTSTNWTLNTSMFGLVFQDILKFYKGKIYTPSIRNYVRLLYDEMFNFDNLIHYGNNFEEFGRRTGRFYFRKGFDQFSAKEPEYPRYRRLYRQKLAATYKSYGKYQSFIFSERDVRVLELYQKKTKGFIELQKFFEHYTMFMVSVASMNSYLSKFFSRRLFVLACVDLAFEDILSIRNSYFSRLFARNCRDLPLFLKKTFLFLRKKKQKQKAKITTKSNRKKYARRRKNCKRGRKKRAEPKETRDNSSDALWHAERFGVDRNKKISMFGSQNNSREDRFFMHSEAVNAFQQNFIFSQNTGRDASLRQSYFSKFNVERIPKEQVQLGQLMSHREECDFVMSDYEVHLLKMYIYNLKKFYFEKKEKKILKDNRLSILKIIRFIKNNFMNFASEVQQLRKLFGIKLIKDYK